MWTYFLSFAYTWAFLVRRATVVSSPTRKASVKVQTSPSHNLGSMFSLVVSLACALGSGNQEQGLNHHQKITLYLLSSIVWFLTLHPSILQDML